MNRAQKAEEVSFIEGRYFYCIINGEGEINLGKIGINDAEVYGVSFKDIAAIVHACQAKPYETKDHDEAKRWVFVHNYVIDKATGQFGTVLPFSFNAISRGGDNAVKDWLNKNYTRLKMELERTKDKAEYAVQVFCDQDKLEEETLSKDQELKSFKEKTEKMSKKAAYLLQRRFELKMKDAVSAEIFKIAEDFNSKIREYTEEIRREKTTRMPEKYRDKRLIVSLSCLVSNAKVEELGKILEEINNREGYVVHFSGSWAPFSFVNLKDGSNE